MSRIIVGAAVGEKKIRGEMASESRSLAPRETGKQSISRKKEKRGRKFAK